MRRIIGGLALVFAMAATGAIAQPPPPPPPPQRQPTVITNPEWLEKPSGQTVWQFYPEAAKARNKDGDVAITCRVAVTGLLRDCKVTRETPEGFGFGDAAIALSTAFKMKPMTRNGQPVDGAMISIPIRFSCEGMCRQPNPAPTDRVFFNMPWASAPTLQQWAAAYPARLRANPVTGGVAMDCVFRDDGHLGRCDFESDQESRRQFGEAATSLTQYFVAPMDVANPPKRGDRVRLNIAFPAELAKGEAPALPSTAVRARPAPEALDLFFPRVARDKGVAFGRAVVECDRNGLGQTVNCSVISETSEGFGEAALKVSALYRFSVWSEDGRMTTTRVRLPFAFGREAEGAESVETLVGRVNAALTAGDLAAAETQIATIASRYPQAELKNLYGRLAYELDKLDRGGEAIAIYDKLAAAGEFGAGDYNNLCWMKATLNIRAETALADCEKSLQLRPGVAATLDSRAFAHLRLGQYAEALIDYDAVLAQTPDLAQSLMGRGITRKALGDIAGGEADIRAARRLSPATEESFRRWGLLAAP